MSFRLMSAVGCVCALLLAPARALAQNPVEDGAPTARVQLGPLGLTPRVSLHDFGVDSNVQRSAGGSKDFTATIEPSVDYWTRVGQARFAAKSGLQWMFFGKTVSQRTLGRNQSVMGSYQFARFVPYAGLTYGRTQRAASVEIDNRVPQTTTSRRIGLATVFTPSLDATVDAEFTGFALDRSSATDVVFADALNRHTRTASVTVHYAATPMTTLVVKTGTQSDEFEGSSLRNSRSLTVTPGVEFKPYALMSGAAFVGYRHFRTADTNVPDFSGLTASVSLTFVAREMTKFTVDVRRDTDYSYEPTQPYFVSTGWGLSMTQMFGPTWDGVARVGRTVMAYRSLTSVLQATRNDVVQTWGTGIGRHMASGTRIGFDVDYLRRTSVVNGRGFHGLRFGGSVTYGS